MRKLTTFEMIDNLAQILEDSIDICSWTTKQIDAYVEGVNYTLFVTQRYTDEERVKIIKAIIRRISNKYSFYESDLLI